MQHATLSPSSSARWLNCPGSHTSIEQARLEGLIVETTNVYQEEGTLAHALAEHMLYHGPDSVPEGSWTEEMVMGARAYWHYVSAIVAEDKRSELLVEERVEVNGDCWGTADTIVWQPGQKHLHVVDYKFGRGHAVDPEKNTQMLIYAIGAIKSKGFRPDKITLHLAQPRIRSGFGSWTIRAGSLARWMKETLLPGIKAAMNPDSVRAPSEDACRWCPIKGLCPEYRSQSLERARRVFGVSLNADPEAIAEALNAVEDLDSFVKALREQAQTMAMQGKKIPGWKLVEGRAVRQWSVPEQDVITTLVARNVPAHDIVETRLLGIPAIEKVAKSYGLDPDVVGGLVTKPRGKPVLAPESDKRPEYKSAESVFQFHPEESENG